MKNIIIIGGGVNGLCTAYYLHKKNYNVTIVDRGDISDNCSFGNMGFLSPSHFIPLASPGIITEGFKYLLSNTSPFYIKPRLDYDFFRWAIRFYRNSTPEMVERNSPHLSALLSLSRDLMNDIRDDLGNVFDMEEKGCMMMCHSEKSFEEELKLVEAARSFHLKVDILQRDDLQKMEPDVELDIYGALLFKDDAHLHPGKFMVAMKKYLIEKGVDFRLNTEVSGFEYGRGKAIKGVITDHGTVAGDKFILCAGSWLPRIAKMVGLDLLLEGGKGYSYTYDHVEKNIRYPAILVDGRCAISPWSHQLRIGGTMEFTGLNDKILAKRMEGIFKTVKRFYPGLDIDLPPRDKIWAGLRPVTPDGLPYLGPVTRFSNLLVAGGNAMLGLSEGAAAGLIISQIVSGQNPPIDIYAFEVERFTD